MSILAREVGEALTLKKLKLGTVESATGGLISHLITEIPGSSEYYAGSIIAYSNQAKIALVGVSQEILAEHGAVSSQVAEALAAKGRELLEVDICVADTGIAGPGGATSGKPVGLFYLGLSNPEGTISRKYIYEGDRSQNKLRAAEEALNWVKEYLAGMRSANGHSDWMQERHVVTCFLEHAGEILILQRSEKVGSYPGRWAGISGGVEKTPDEQALKEIREETGLTRRNIDMINKAAPIKVIDEELKIRWIVHPYLFRVANPARIQLDWEHQESKWIKPDEIDRYPTVPGLKTALMAVSR